MKLVDESGENVWWSVQRDFVPPAARHTIRLKKRRFSFAWGPAGGGEIRRASAIEIAITARSGGAGWIELENLTFAPLPPSAPDAAPRQILASSARPGFDPARALDGDLATAWRSAPGRPAWLAVDFGVRREFGGLTLRWEEGRSPSRYIVETSDDGRRWTAARAVVRPAGLRDDLFLPESEARRIRVRAAEPSSPAGYGLAELTVRPLAFGDSMNAFFEAIARESPRGFWPRSFSGEQTYWTVAGVSGDTESALVSEDGAVEPSAGAFSVEPFLFVDGRLRTWADGASRQTLEQGDLPIPRVLRDDGGLSLGVVALASGNPEGATLSVRYRVANTDGARRTPRLFLAVRPIQVNPPSQFLNRPGGASSIRSLSWTGDAVMVDGRPRIHPWTAPAGFGALPFDQGRVPDVLADGGLPSSKSADDPFGHASGALAFDFDLAAGASDEITIELPIHPYQSAPPPAASFESRQEAARAFSARLDQASRAWRERLDRVVFVGPAEARELFRTARVNLADILVERDGHALRPGTRAYARSWIRDGAMMAAALLRMGHAEEARSYADWYVRYQSPEGRVPCCVDRRGADAVVENDSHGELLYLIAEVWRYTGDRQWLAGMLPHVEGAVSWIDRERQRRRTAAERTPERRIFFGLLPESISHEGYSAKPVHSYWDDFWALEGLKDAVRIARAAGRADLAARWGEILREFAVDLHASISRVMETRGIDFIPGSADLADFDATSTTIALDPAGELEDLPRDALERTFHRYDREFEARKSAPEWDYTPYEIRNVGAFVRLGWRDRIPDLLAFFLASRRPPGWGAWAEGVASDPRKIKFVGDIPHAWVGSDFIRSLTDLFFWMRESDGAAVLASGVPAGWLDSGEDVGVRGLRTSFGLLSYSMRRQDGVLRVHIDPGPAPAGGFVVRPPVAGGDCLAELDGAPVSCRGGEVLVRRRPAEVVFRTRPR